MILFVKTKTIIFDFDGTIADTLDAAIAIYNKIAHQFQCKTVKEENRAELRSKKAQDFLRDHGVTKLKLPFVVLLMQKELRREIATLKPFEGIVEELEKIKSAGYNLGIMTSNSKENIQVFLAAHELTHIFDFIYSSKNIFGKAHMMKRLLHEQKITKNDAIYVGDETRDIEATKKIHLPMLAVSWGYNSKEALSPLKPDLIADHPNEILSCLKQIHG